ELRTLADQTFSFGFAIAINYTPTSPIPWSGSGSMQFVNTGSFPHSSYLQADDQSDLHVESMTLVNSSSNIAATNYIAIELPRQNDQFSLSFQADLSALTKWDYNANDPSQSLR